MRQLHTILYLYYPWGSFRVKAISPHRMYDCYDYGSYSCPRVCVCLCLSPSCVLYHLQLLLKICVCVHVCELCTYSFIMTVMIIYVCVFVYLISFNFLIHSSDISSRFTKTQFECWINNVSRNFVFIEINVFFRVNFSVIAFCREHIMRSKIQ